MSQQERKDGHRSSLSAVGKLAKDTFSSSIEDKVPKLSGSLAYYTVFSMGPLLVLIISLCGLFFERQAIEGRVYSTLQDFVGQDTAEQLKEVIANASITGKSTTAAIVGIVTLLVGATTVFAEIQDSINGIWGLKAKPRNGWLKILQNRFLSFSVIVSLGFLLLVSLVVTSLVEGLSRRLQARFSDVAVVVFYIANLVLTFGVSTSIFAVIFKVLPDARIRWKDVFAGALITAALFMAGKFGISFYIARSKIGSTYGAAGSLVVLISWVYYSAIILYLGAEFTKAYASMYGSPIMPNDYAVTTKQVEVETGKKTVQEAEETAAQVKENK